MSSILRIGQAARDGFKEYMQEYIEESILKPIRKDLKDVREEMSHLSERMNGFDQELTKLQRKVKDDIGSFRQEVAENMKGMNYRVEEHIGNASNDIRGQLDNVHKRIENRFGVFQADMLKKVDTLQRKIEVRVDRFQTDISLKVDYHKEDLEKRIKQVHAGMNMIFDDAEKKFYTKFHEIIGEEGSFGKAFQDLLEAKLDDARGGLTQKLDELRGKADESVANLGKFFMNITGKSIARGRKALKEEPGLLSEATPVSIEIGEVILPVGEIPQVIPSEIVLPEMVTPVAEPIPASQPETSVETTPISPDLPTTIEPIAAGEIAPTAPTSDLAEQVEPTTPLALAEVATSRPKRGRKPAATSTAAEIKVAPKAKRSPKAAPKVKETSKEQDTPVKRRAVSRVRTEKKSAVDKPKRPGRPAKKIANPEIKLA